MADMKKARQEVQDFLMGNSPEYFTHSELSEHLGLPLPHVQHAIRKFNLAGSLRVTKAHVCMGSRKVNAFAWGHTPEQNISIFRPK